MPSSNIADFVDQLREARVLDAAQLQEVSQTLKNNYSDPKALAKELVRRAWLTIFQANELLKGRGKDLAIGPYLLIDKLGEGGMGAVYKARHQMMKRSVAVKVLRPSGLNGAAIQRFQQEIEIAAALSHPHIVMAHDAGRAGDHFYFAMEHLEGATLSQVVQQRGPLPIAEACLYALQTALALEHAWEKGLVHRDLKPANLFLTGGGTIKLLDLGLARVQRSADKAGRALTQLGAIMGTPDYMSPEQIGDARGVDIRGDIYSLGCTLYFLLTGKVPFRGKSLAEKMDAHLKTAAPPVSARRLEVPAALDAVVCKMMAKNPADRYQTPTEVAQALRPFCATAPVATPLHPPVAALAAEDTVAINSATTSEVAAPRPKRRRWGLLAAAVLAVVVLLLGTWLWMGGKGTKSSNGSGPEPNEPIVVGEPIRVPFDSRWLDALDAAKIPAVERYSWQPKELVAVLGEHRLRGDYVAVRPDGKQIASSNNGNPYLGSASVLLGDAETLHVRQALPIRANALAYAPDSRLLALAVGPVVQLLDPDSGAEVRKLKGPDAATSGVTTVSFSADGKSLLAGDSLGKLWLWDVATGKRLHQLDAHASTVKSVACAAGDRAVSCGGPGDAKICLWNLKEGKLLAQIDFRRDKLDLDSYVSCVAITRDGKKVLSAHSDKSVRLWDVKVDALAEVRRLEGHQDVPKALAFSPDGQKIATAIAYGGPAVRCWETVSGKELPPFNQAFGGSLAFFPDGKRLVVANIAVRVLDVETGKELQPPFGHLTRVQCAALAPTGRHLASGEPWYGGCRMWDLASGKDRAEGGFNVTQVAFTGDGRRYFYVGQDIKATPFRDVETGAPDPKSPTFSFAGEGFITSASLSVDERYLLVSQSNIATLWDLRGEVKAVQRITHGDGSGCQIALSPDSRRALCSRYYEPGRVEWSKLFDLSSGTEITSMGTRGIALFASDGKVVRLDDSPGSLWDVSGEKPIQTSKLPFSPGTPRFAALSRDDSRLTTVADTPPRLTVWDMKSGAEVWKWDVPAPFRVESVVLSPDGRYLITANANGTLYIIRLPSAPT